MTRELSSHDSDVLDMIFDITKIDSNFKDATKPVIDELPADIKGKSNGFFLNHTKLPFYDST